MEVSSEALLLILGLSEGRVVSADLGPMVVLENRYFKLFVRRLVEFIGSGGKVTELDIVIGHDVISPNKISTQNGVIRILSLFND